MRCFISAVRVPSCLTICAACPGAEREAFRDLCIRRGTAHCSHHLSPACLIFCSGTRGTENEAFKDRWRPQRYAQDWTSRLHIRCLFRLVSEMWKSTNWLLPASRRWSWNPAERRKSAEKLKTGLIRPRRFYTAARRKVM